MFDSRFTYLGVHSQLMGHTEVRDNDVQWHCASDQDVCSAEVTMDDAQGVQVVHASRTLLQDGDRRRQWQHLHNIGITER